MINLSSKPITISISPDSGNTNTIFNITTDVNATIFIDGANKGSAFKGTLSAGNHEIEAYKEGYLDAKENFTVDSSIIFSSSGEFKKGVMQTFTINKNVSWTVSYQKDGDALEQIASGTGDKIEFEPNKVGTYIIEAEDAKRNYVIQGRDWGYKFWFMAWYYWIIVIALGIYGYYYFTNSTPSSNVDVGFSGNARY